MDFGAMKIPSGHLLMNSLVDMLQLETNNYHNYDDIHFYHFRQQRFSWTTTSKFFLKENNESIKNFNAIFGDCKGDSFNNIKDIIHVEPYK